MAKIRHPNRSDQYILAISHSIHVPLVPSHELIGLALRNPAKNLYVDGIPALR